MSRPQRKRKEVIYKEVTSLDGDENDYQASSPKKQKPSRKAAEKTQQKANAAGPGARQENGGRLSVRERKEQADLALALQLSASENRGYAQSEPVPAADEDPLLAYDTAKPRSKAKSNKSGGEDVGSETKRSTSENSSQHEEELSDVESVEEDDEEDFDFKSKSKRKPKSRSKETAKPTSKMMSRARPEPAHSRQSHPASKAKRATESSSVIAPVQAHAITQSNPLTSVTPEKIAMRTPATASTPQLEQNAQPEAISTFTSSNSSSLPPYINKLPIRIGLSRRVAKPLLKTIGRKQP
ncbi:hypothetical protein HDU85_003524 [Gaertneriomyces sp. JEL0708]|nr:hypothetical protein HDU85_003524 [Gaertneriomyces sp. JEL0708]